MCVYTYIYIFKAHIFVPLWEYDTVYIFLHLYTLMVYDTILIDSFTPTINSWRISDGVCCIVQIPYEACMTSLLILLHVWGNGIRWQGKGKSEVRRQNFSQTISQRFPCDARIVLPPKKLTNVQKGHFQTERSLPTMVFWAITSVFKGVFYPHHGNCNLVIIRIIEEWWSIIRTLSCN